MLVKLFIVGYVGIVIISLASFLEDYFILSPYKTAEAMLYGNLEVAQILSDFGKEKSSIIVSRKLSEPHIYFAFAEQWNPKEYQGATENWDFKALNVNWVDQIPEYKLGKYTFKNIDWNKDSMLNTYLVGKPEEFPAAIEPLVVIKYPNNQPAIYIVDPNVKNFAYARD